MGVAPGEFARLTPSELFEVQEAYTEAHGGRSRRQTQQAWSELERLKRLYPDTLVAGNA